MTKQFKKELKGGIIIAPIVFLVVLFIYWCFPGATVGDSNDKEICFSIKGAFEFPHTECFKRP